VFRSSVDARPAADFTGWVRPHLPAMAALAARPAGAADRDDVVQEALAASARFVLR
jgi:DNA-directed RNA polymerase specialized sigma24 family protein